MDVDCSGRCRGERLLKGANTTGAAIVTDGEITRRTLSVSWLLIQRRRDDALSCIAYADTDTINHIKMHLGHHYYNFDIKIKARFLSESSLLLQNLAMLPLLFHNVSIVPSQFSHRVF